MALSSLWTTGAWLLGAKQRINKERFQLAENLRSARCSPFVISKVLAARVRKLITARARKINALLVCSQMLEKTIRCPFCWTYTAFVNNLLALFLTMSVLSSQVAWSLHSLLVASYTPFICTLWAIWAHSPSPFCIRYFNSKYLMLYSSNNLAINLAKLTRTNFCRTSPFRLSFPALCGSSFCFSFFSSLAQI